MTAEEKDAGDPSQYAPELGSTQSRRAARATEAVIDGVATEFGLLDATEAGVRLGAAVESARDLANSRHRSGDLLAIRRHDRRQYPGFQFRIDGTPRPVVRTLRSLWIEHGWSEGDLLLWLVTPAGRLDDARPVDIVLSETDDADARVVGAAEVEISMQW